MTMIKTTPCRTVPPRGASTIRVFLYSILVAVFSRPTLAFWIPPAERSFLLRPRQHSSLPCRARSNNKNLQVVCFNNNNNDLDAGVPIGISDHSKSSSKALVRKDKTALTRTHDSLDQLASDIAIVLNQLRPEHFDPTLSSISQTPWTLEDWNRHLRRFRYLDYIRPSELQRRILPQLSVLLGWTCLAVWLCDKRWMPRLALPLTPLSLVSTVVAALLTLRSHQGLTRFQQGQQALHNVVLYTRDTSQLIAASVYPKNKYLGLKLARHVALFGWLLKHSLQGPKSQNQNKKHDKDVIRAMMVSKADADYILQQRKRPVAVIARLRQVIANMQGQLSTAEEMALHQATQNLNACITTTERIVQSPIPPIYTSHIGRLLLLYLFGLPLALKSVLTKNLPTVLATTAVGWVLLGLDELAHLLEQPLPLYHFAKRSMMDVADALICQPPSLNEDDEHNAVYKKKPPPPYWNDNPKEQSTRI